MIRFEGGNVSTFPMLTSYQRTSIWESFGTFCFSGRDGEVEKVKIYSTLGHALKAFGRATNFGTLPKTVKQMQRRVSQAREFWHFTRGFEMFGRWCQQLGSRSRYKKTATLVTTLNEAWQVGSEIAGGLESLLIPVDGDEAQRLLGVAATHSSTHGRVTKNL